MSPARRHRICLIGWGAISRRVAELLQARAPCGIEVVAVAVRDPSQGRADIPAAVRLITSPEEIRGLAVDLVVEAAGHEAVKTWGKAALNAGVDLMVSSTGALSDNSVFAELVALAEHNGCRLIIPAGALAAIDGLSAASSLGLDQVEHRIVKPSGTWRGTSAESLIDLNGLTTPSVFFRGTARDAAARFPQNANASAIVAMAGIGMDKTVVTLVADPFATRNAHEIRASGAFGCLEMRIESVALATNPKSSEMTALNLVRQIENRMRSLAI